MSTKHSTYPSVKVMMSTASEDIHYSISDMHSGSSWFGSIQAILSQCPARSLFTLGLIVFLNVLASVLPILYFVQVSSAIQQMGKYHNDRQKYYEEMQVICIMMLGFGVAYILITTLASFLILLFSRKQGRLWRFLYFKSLLWKMPGFYDLNPEITSGMNINTECSNIEEALGDDLMLFIAGVSLLIGMWLLSLSYSLELTLICVVIFPFQYFGMVLLNRKSIESSTEALKMYSIAGLKSEETFENINTVASLNCQEVRIQEYAEQLKPLTEACARDGIKTGVGWGLNFSVMFALNGVMFYTATVYIIDGKNTWIQGNIDISDVIIVFYCYFMGSTLIGTFLPSLKKIINGIASAKNIKKITKEEDFTMEKSMLAESQWKIRFRHVKFCYPAKPDIFVLNDLSFRIHPGKTVGIVGTTGCGKSTIAQLLLGFYNLASGKILINRVSLEDLDLRSVRSFISYVNQEPLLFSTSIRKNVKLGNQDCTEVELEDVLHSAEAYSFIENMPDKLDSYVGNKGSHLSGGEKQRIALARAFLRNPRLLILDEATSALDAITENIILENIREKYHDTAVLVIAQRLRTVKNADTIHYLEDGAILESGTFDELVENKAHFYELMINKPLHEVVEESKSVLDEEHKEQRRYSKEFERKISKEIVKKVSEKNQPQRVSLVPCFYPLLIILILISSSISGTAFPIFGYFFAQVLTNIFMMKENAKDLNFDIMLYIIGDGIALFTFLVLLYYSLSKLFGKYTAKLRHDGFSSLVYYDDKFFSKKKNTPQALSTVLREESQKTSAFGGPALAIPLILVFSVIGGAILAMISNPIYATVYIAMIFIDLYVITKATSTFFQSGFSQQSSEKLVDLVSNALTNYKTVTALSLQEYFYGKYTKELDKQMEINSKIFLKAGFMYSWRYGIDFFLVSVIMWIGAYFVKIDLIEINNVIQVMEVLNSSTWILIIVSILLPDINAALKASKIMGNLISYTPEINSKSTSGIKSGILGAIEFSEVSFWYKCSDSPTLSDIRLKINPGESLGITGKTGSGKSTLTKLLLRFYNPSSGSIFIDGHNISNYNIEYLRSRISWVGQEPVLFQGSILENLRLACKEITTAEALEALSKAQAMDIVNTYGIDTDVGFRGSFLSGGQKQRVAIARALARKPAVLILDEATSALDNNTQEKVAEAIRLEKITVISIAHRINTIFKCDQLIIIEKGVIVQRGDHRKLSEVKGIYRKLVKGLNL